MNPLIQFGLEFVVAFQRLGWLAGGMQAVTVLGNEEFFLFAVPLVYWCLDANLGLRLGLMLVTSNALDDGLRLAFRFPRPYWLDSRVRALGSPEWTFGLPSAHALNSTALWGTAAAYFKRAWFWVLALLVVLLVSLSRLYLGLHFPHDVVASWLLGAALLWVALRSERRVAEGWRGLSLVGQLGVALAVAFAYVAAMVVVNTAWGWAPTPAEWLRQALAATGLSAPESDPSSLHSTATNGGMLLGAGIGLTLAGRYARFDASGPWPQRVLRFAVGMAGVLALWGGLKLVFPDGDTLLPLALRFVRYTLALTWVVGVAPWTFVKLGLAPAAVDWLPARAAAGENARSAA